MSLGSEDEYDSELVVKFDRFYIEFLAENVNTNPSIFSNFIFSSLSLTPFAPYSFLMCFYSVVYCKVT